MKYGIRECLVALAAVVVSATGVVASEPAAETTKPTVVGKVADVSKAPIAGAEVILFSDTGAEIARTTTDSVGTYSFGCVTPGSYEIQLMPTSGFEGERVKAPVGANGLTVAWVVDQQKSALASASATGGACGSSAVAAEGGGTTATVYEMATVNTATAGSGSPVAAAIIGGGALAGGVGVAIASGVDAFDSDLAPDSPAQ